MITTVSLNPAIDKTILTGSIVRGEVNRLKDAREDIGGKAINVSKILNRFGIQTQVCGLIGNKNIKKIEEMLLNENLEHKFIEVEGITRTDTKVVELDEGITTDLNEPGFFVTKDQTESFIELMNNEAEQSKFVVFSGSIPKGVSSTIYQELIMNMRKETKTVLDADGELLLHGIKAGPYMMKPNIHELEAAFDVKLNSDYDIVAFCKKLLVEYDIKIIIVSMGGKGSLMITNEKSYKAEPVKVVVKSTVGAGDSMIAGMLYGIEKGLSDKEAFAYATACGTLAVTKEGTQTFSLEEVSEILKRVEIEEID